MSEYTREFDPTVGMTDRTRVNGHRKLMRGVTDIRAAMERYLSEQMPRQIDFARAQWGMSESELPYPSKYDSYDPMVANTYPTVGCLVTRSRGFRRVDYDRNMNEAYQIVYTTRVFLWVKTLEDVNTTYHVDQPYEATLKLRDDMLAILRSTLLTDLSVGTATDDVALLTLDEGTLVEEYFDAIRKSEQVNTWYAGGSISFDLEAVESQYASPVGYADTITTNVSHLNPITEEEY